MTSGLVAKPNTGDLTPNKPLQSISKYETVPTSVNEIKLGQQSVSVVVIPAYSNSWL